MSTLSGWGTLPYGTGEFGTGIDVSGADLSDSLSIADALTVSVPFEVTSAESLSSILVRVDFSGFLDPGHATNFTPSNYVISGLTVSHVDPFGGRAVLLTTSLQSNITYTVVVNSTAGQIQGVGGDQLDPAHHTASFQGTLTLATFTAIPQSRRKVRITFNQPMTVNSDFLDPGSYQIADFGGASITITSVVAIDSSHAELALAQDLAPFVFYSLQVGPLVRAATGAVVFPDTRLIQWQEVVPHPIRISISRFSGEVTGGILGTPAGQIFFSPSFGTASPNSTLQVDSTSVCTRAYDVYTIPSLPDPQILYTFPARAGTTSIIGATGGVLRASANRLGLAQMVVSDLREDSVAPPVDGSCSLTLSETIDITRAAFLNDARWKIFPNPNSPPSSLGPFRTADNLTSIGPGPNSHQVFVNQQLQMQESVAAGP